ncbi:MAG: putative DegV protein [Clostridiales bacterium]|jgi:DegV family protein with EDD domain|nr:putative DegV protein [Clostridiales bacterium]
MNNIRIVTDSTAYIQKEYANSNNIDIVPLMVDFEGVTNAEGFTGEFEEFFNRLKTSESFPKTSQPSIGAFAQVFKEALENGEEVIAIVISSKLSGTYNSASAAADMVAPNKISVIDSETSASNLRMLVEKAKKLSASGVTREEIVNIINIEKKRTGINLTVDTLEYLKKGGRLSTGQALIGSILNIKPIIALVDGELVPIGKARGKSKAIEMMISNIPEKVEKISICQIFNMEEALEIREILKKKYPKVDVTIDALGPVIGAHLGPKAIGICFKW